MQTRDRWSSLLITAASLIVSTSHAQQTEVRIEPAAGSGLRHGQILRLSGQAEPGSVAGGYFDPASSSLQPVRLDSEAVLRETPQGNGRSLGKVGAKILNNEVLLTGQAKPGWVEVVYGSQTAWLAQGAVTGLPDFIAKRSGMSEVPAVADVPKTKPAPVTEEALNLDQIPGAKPSTASAPKAPPPKPAEKKEPRCVSTYQEYRNNKRLVKAMGGSNPYAQWTGPAGATINVSTSGMAMINHPLKGQFSVNTTLCVDASSQPYITVMGQNIYFEGPGKSSVSIHDPESGQAYQFTKSMQ